MKAHLNRLCTTSLLRDQSKVSTTLSFPPCETNWLLSHLLHVPIVKSLPGPRASYFHSVLHDWSNADCHRILSNMMPMLEEGHSVISLQGIVVPDKDAHWQLTSLDGVDDAP